MARRRTWTAVLSGAAVCGLLVLLLAGGWWRVDGGRWFTVTTPSMGVALPVGSVLLTTPSTVAATEPGDVVTFRNPQTGIVFTHRVVSKDGTGLETRGDANGVADAWRITDDELVGRVVGHAEGVGWLVRALPLLLLGLGLVWLATRWVRPTARWSWRVLGISLVVSLVNWWLHPWVGLTRLGQSPPPAGEDGVVMDVISTGLLPIRAIEVDGPAAAHLQNGQIGSLHLTAGADRGAFDIASVLDLTWVGWVLMALCVVSPLLLTVAVGLPPRGDRLGDAEDDAGTGEQDAVVDADPPADLVPVGAG
ncbi:hypothetical protein [Nocardioides sp.]|uniref:hypothetical protein n=1 Tax=Nocardioides sp. TaxID=35761 RepID=UPI0027243126|nr:hypothetical protein [Nocardioides sp.]MDO9456906.1 hypothetical protein [Nocardioides sp.]